MKLSRYDNIVAIKTDSGKVVGFHAHNLQVAHLDDAVWQTLHSPADAPKDVQDEIALWNLERDPSATDSNLTPEVRSLTINIAQICNLKCTYCAAGGDGSYGDPMKEVDLSTVYDQLRMLLHDVPNHGDFRITFLGGEPLVAPEAIRSIARFAKLQTAGRDIELRYDIVTNGTLITPKIAELLASIRCHVTISLDGPTEINDQFRLTRGGGGSTARALKGLANLQAVRERLGSLRAGAVFGKHHTDVLATYRFLQPHRFDSIKFDFAAEAEDAEASQAYMLSLAETADFAFRSGGEPELRTLAMFDAYFRILDSQSRVHNHCGAGKNHLQVDTRGRFYICQWFVNDAQEEVGSGTELDHEKLKKFADPLTELNGCQDCWAKHLCGGGCMFVHKTKTGSKHKKDNEYCIRTRHIIAKGIEHYAEARYQSGTSGR